MLQFDQKASGLVFRQQGYKVGGYQICTDEKVVSGVVSGK